MAQLRWLGERERDQSNLVRYMPLRTLESTVLSRALRFSSVTKMENLELPDRYEGHLPDWKVAEWDREWAARATAAEWPPEWANLNAAEHIVRAFRRTTVVSCWAQKPESLPMWSVYGDRGHGVALVATPESIYCAISKGLASVQEVDDETIFVGGVQYPTSRGLRSIPLDPVRVGFIKRPIFAWEREVRFALLLPPESAPFRDVPIDLAALLIEVIIGPNASLIDEARIRDILAEAAPSVPVRRSEVLEWQWSEPL